MCTCSHFSWHIVLLYCSFVLVFQSKFMVQVHSASSSWACVKLYITLSKLVYCCCLLYVYCLTTSMSSFFSARFKVLVWFMIDKLIVAALNVFLNCCYFPCLLNVDLSLIDDVILLPAKKQCNFCGSNFLVTALIHRYNAFGLIACSLWAIVKSTQKPKRLMAVEKKQYIPIIFILVHLQQSL